MGTSMATPVVAGLVAAVKSKMPGANYKKIVDAVLDNGTYHEDLKGLIQTSSVVNVARTLNSL
jgi:subtilisin family serine protease